jgi:hypothetical protein
MLASVLLFLAELIVEHSRMVSSNAAAAATT